MRTLQMGPVTLTLLTEDVPAVLNKSYLYEARTHAPELAHLGQIGNVITSSQVIYYSLKCKIADPSVRAV